MLLRSTWTFKIKTNPSTGEITKYKARFCVDGRRQIHNINYFETYSPVVRWSSIRTCLTLSSLHNWATRAIDFDQAYTQADVDADIYIHLPAGFQIPGPTSYVIKLIKNLYGLKQGGYNFYEKLKYELLRRDFIMSEVDPCIFYKKGIIVLTYVDDCLIFAQDSSLVTDFYNSLQKDFNCTDEGEADGYLGVEIKKNNSTITLKQPQLVKRACLQLGLQDANPKSTPIVKPLLHAFINGKERDPSAFHHRSAIGILSYLAGCTRPDMSMPVNQAAKYSNDPKAAHDTAVKRIGKRLLGTLGKGLEFKTDATKGLEVCVDADFAGACDSDASDDPTSVCSRTGFVIKHQNCPIL